jgi:integrase
LHWLFGVQEAKQKSVFRTVLAFLFRLWFGALFSEIAHQVLMEKQLKAQETRAAATRQIRRLVANFGGMPVRRITEEHWVEYVIRERAKRERTFFDDRKYMRLVLGHAARRRQIPRIIELTIPDLPSETGRELQPWELKALREAAAVETPDGNGRGAGANQKSPDLLFQIDIAWKMGLRLREMLRLRWDQVNLDRGTIRLKARDRKNRRALEIPINPDLLAEFSRRKRLAARQEWVFPNPAGTGPISNNKTAWRRCKRDAGVDSRWHDFRHHSASALARGGCPRHVTRAMLGMSEQTLDKVYVHLDLDDKKKAALLLTDAAQTATIEDLWKAARMLSEAGKTRRLG